MVTVLELKASSYSRCGSQPPGRGTGTWLSLCCTHHVPAACARPAVCFQARSRTPRSSAGLTCNVLLPGALLRDAPAPPGWVLLS